MFQNGSIKEGLILPSLFCTSPKSPPGGSSLEQNTSMCQKKRMGKFIGAIPGEALTKTQIHSRSPHFMYSYFQCEKGNWFSLIDNGEIQGNIFK